MKSFALLIFLFAPLCLSAQKSSLTKQIALLRFSSPAASCPDSLALHSQSSSIGFVVSFYKALLEQQDSQACVFTPTCADFWAETAAQKGLIAAWFMGFDRLSKCSPLSTKNYPSNNKGLMIDPVK